MRKLLQELISDTSSPTLIITKLLEHCEKTVLVGKTWMEENHGKKLPEDYSKFPGYIKIFKFFFYFLK